MARLGRKRAKAPDKTGKARKDQDVRFRVTSGEKEALQRAADKAGLALSPWLRQLALRTAGALPEQE